MLVDEDKVAQDVTADDIKELIGIHEQQRLDLKKEPYGKHKKQECLKDISAMANAQGGYIILGMDEINGTATEVCGVNPDDVHPEIERILQWLHHGVTPPIRPSPTIHSLNIDGKTVAVIQIPISENKPHRVSFDPTQAQFYIRCGDSIPVMGYEELREMFLARPEALRLQRVEKSLEHIVTVRTDHERLQIKLSEEDLLGFSTTDAFLSAAQKVFLDAIKGQACFRIISVSKPFASREIIRNNAEAIARIVAFPETQSRDWIRPIGKVASSHIGIISTDRAFHHIRVLWNGCVEFWSTVTDFYLDHDAPGSKTLNPYGLVYSICAFIDLLKQIYQLLNWREQIVVQAGYFNITGFRLVGGHTNSVNYRMAMAGSSHADVGLANASIIVSDVIEIPLDNLNDALAYSLVKQIYMAFGLTKKAIPGFDENGNRQDSD